MFHYSHEICLCVVLFLAALHFILPRAEHREQEEEKLGHQILRICHCVIWGFFSPLLHVLMCVVSARFHQCLLTRLPCASSFHSFHLIWLHPSASRAVSFTLFCALSYFALLFIFCCFLVPVSADIGMRFRSLAARAR